MKRIAIAVLVGGVVFGAVFGLAASINVSSDGLGAGNASVAACQSGTLTSSFATAYDSSIPGYAVSTVTVSGLQSGCYDKDYSVTLTGSGNAPLGEVAGTTPSSGAGFDLDFGSAGVAAAALTGVHVVIAS